MNIDPNKVGLLASFKTPGVAEAYRKWATLPETATFLSLAADLVCPNPSTPETRSTHAEAIASLVRKETAEEFMEACLRLEDYAMLAEDNGLPPSNYGAEPPPEVKKARKPAKPVPA